MRINKLFFLFTTGLLLNATICCSQVTILSGKVTDEITALPVAGVSVMVNHEATSTDENGEFNLVVNKAVALQHGITLSCIGYQKKSIAYRQSPYYLIKLQPASIVNNPYHTEPPIRGKVSH